MQPKYPCYFTGTNVYGNLSIPETWNFFLEKKEEARNSPLFLLGKKAAFQGELRLLLELTAPTFDYYQTRKKMAL